MMKLVLATVAMCFALAEAPAQNIEVIKYPQLLEMIKECPGKEIQVFNFWATWCKPCIEELPYLERLNEEYENVQVNLICLDDLANLETKVYSFVNEKKMKSSIFLIDMLII